jgi:hypothetical protein
MNGNTAQRHAAARNTRRVKFLSRVPPAGLAQSTIHPNTAGENNDGATDPRRVSAASIIAIPLATICRTTPCVVRAPSPRNRSSVDLMCAAILARLVKSLLLLTSEQII